MSILSGFSKFKKYLKTSSGYKLSSLWTSSETVEMGNGNTLEENLGEIKGITSSLATDNSNYALSASGAKDLQDQITALNSDFVNQYIQSGLAYTNNANGYFRKATITFNTPYKTGTVPTVVASSVNYASNTIDVRVNCLVSNVTNTGFTISIGDPNGELANQGYQAYWISVGIID